MANIAAISQLTAEKGVEALIADTDPMLKVIDKSYNATFSNGTFQSGQTINIRVEDQPAEMVQQTAFNNDPIIQKELPVTALNYTTGLEIGTAFEQFDIGGPTFLDDRVNKARMRMAAVKANQVAYAATVSKAPRFLSNYAAGTAIKTATDFGYVRAALTNMIASGGLYCAMQPDDMAQVAGDLAGKFNPTTDSSTAYLDGVVKMAAGLNMYESTLIPYHTNGSAVATGAAGMYLSANVTTGATSFTVAGGTANGIITAGSIVFFPGNGSTTGANEVNPTTKQTLSNKAGFTVAETVQLSGSGVGTITVTQAIYGPENNKLQNVSRLPTVDGTAAYVQIYGTASHTYRQMFAFKKETFAAFIGLKQAELIRNDNGIAYYDRVPVQTAANGDIMNRVNIMRLDLLAGATLTQWRHCVRMFTADVT